MATGTPNLEQAVAKARERAGVLGEDLLALSDRTRGASPDTVASRKQINARRRFLESLYDDDRQARQAFERIIGGNELQDVNFLERGALVARTVLRIVIRSGGGRILGYGSGMMVGDGVLLTNNHVLPNSDVARASYAEAFYEKDLEGDEARTRTFGMQPDKLFYTYEPLDFSLVALSPRDRSGDFELASLGWTPLIGKLGKVLEGEWMTIVQHPKGERKQLAVRENQLLKCEPDVLWYSTDTLGGSSGSPVYNNDWLMVALHHSGVPETREGRWQTVDGRDYDPDRDNEDKIKWIANEGIRVSRILETLRSDNSIANHPLVGPLLRSDVGDIQVRLPVLYREGHRPTDTAAAAQSPPTPPTNPTEPEERGMTKRQINVTLEIDDDGRVSVAGSSARETSLVEERPSKRKPSKLQIDAPVDEEKDWLQGYRPDFLGTGDLLVNLPDVDDDLKPSIAPLIDAYGQKFTAEQRLAGVLTYSGYSVVMNKDRRFAFYSAANVDWGMRPNVSGRADDWLFDKRIKREHQVDNSLYRANEFDRGHLTRREDMEWGANPHEAVRRANGTSTWTNCTPQHEIFNQDKHPDESIQLWQGLERYILEDSAKAKGFSLQAFTGPIFGIADPVYRGIQIPLDYWKVVVAVTDQGRLFATGYILGQKDVIDQFGVKEAERIPFGTYGTYQRPIATIEQLTGLKFTYGAARRPLSEVDPLARPTWRQRRRRASASESFGGGGDDALGGFGDIVLD